MPRPPDLPRDEQVLKKEIGPCGRIEFRVQGNIGMRTALKIKLEPAGDMIRFDAGVGIFGLQAIPTAITLFVTWPVLLTQIWGLIRQSELDDKALEIAKKAIRDLAHANCLQEPDRRCPHDGCRIPANSAYCPYCGAKIK